MKILLSNDDGVFSVGINTLAAALSDIADVTIVAPDRNKSGVSNSLTLEMPLKARQIEDKIYSVQGNPADCIHFALNEVFENKPDLLISGINHGANLGDDMIYSGTVAAATEGYLFGVPSIAVSLVGRGNFSDAANYIRELVLNIQSTPLPTDRILNINIPSCPRSEWAGVKVTHQGQREHILNMVKQRDPRGEDAYWIGAAGKGITVQINKEQANSDFTAIENNYVSITPIKIDLTAYEDIAKVAQWLESKENQLSCKQ
ncbi:5'/3'-nucleotidase SurE [Vibrio sp. SS-MA-C1-2]|uniref:5'/3'-nucleotidase SurE n=1 Tax=Vibrio sp. SS-MA-C1-2 TaxID=2908646 RepID=UPI001F40B50A|nr:5'/3'-nucleotidase SurE [Vibrio sp. SS-MA-C1-2]UJF19019.1 5'/3'-nucleotidase SurE [Vibrio sp. SS-MA-C1-2]